MNFMRFIKIAAFCFFFLLFGYGAFFVSMTSPMHAYQQQIVNIPSLTPQEWIDSYEEKSCSLLWDEMLDDSFYKKEIRIRKKKSVSLRKKIIKKTRSSFLPKGLKKNFKAPLKKVRISSRYGRRFHPILRKKCFHKGVDLCAKRGTPVHACQSGVIKERKRCASYGNCVVIDHGNGYSTLYAHLHSIKSKIKVGSKIERGEILGSVGSTGRSTAPHLHLELRKDGKHINPQEILSL